MNMNRAPLAAPTPIVRLPSQSANQGGEPRAGAAGWRSNSARTIAPSTVERKPVAVACQHSARYPHATRTWQSRQLGRLSH
jgi:hypothetical protein